MKIAVLPQLILQRIIIGIIISLIIRVGVIHHLHIGPVRSHRVADRHAFVHDLHQVIDHPVYRYLQILPLPCLHIAADLYIKEGIDAKYGDEHTQ
ncbi:hypothetical protein D3C73_845410 [compost metagenome]